MTLMQLLVVFFFLRKKVFSVYVQTHKRKMEVKEEKLNNTQLKYS